MAITYPLDFPTTSGIVNSSLNARSGTSINISPFTGAQQVYSWPLSYWTLSIELPAMKKAQAEEYICFLTKLYGRTGTFTISPPDTSQPFGYFNFQNLITVRGTSTGPNVVRGTSTGPNVVRGMSYAPAVNGDLQTGNTLNVSGFPASSAVMSCGDFFQLGSGLTTRLYKVLDDVVSDASGEASLNIFPRLRISPSNGESLVFENPKGLFRLADNQQDFSSNNNKVYRISFNAVEVVSG